jgi:hypothetical protein
MNHLKQAVVSNIEIDNRTIAELNDVAYKAIRKQGV